MGWMFNYSAKVPNLSCGDNSTIRMDPDNVPQPDCYLRIDSERDGQSRLEDGYVVGAPELIAEVAASSVSYDLHDKFRACQRNAVGEYSVWRTRDQAIDWFVLRNGRYELMKPDDDGILRSENFPGLWLDPQAMINNDLPRVMAVLEQGLKSASSA